MTETHTINSFFSSMLHIPLQGYSAFEEFNKRGIVTVCALAIIVFSVLVYIAALFNTFQQGFSLQRLAAESQDISERITVLELELQKRQGDVASVTPEHVAGMEKISSIRYIGLEQATAFLSR